MSCAAEHRRAVPAASTSRAIRADFPDPAQTVHGKPLVYLDNAAWRRSRSAVIDAIVALLRAQDTPTCTAACTTCSASAPPTPTRRARDKVAALHQRRATRAKIVFTRGTTEAINLVAQSFGRAVPRGRATRCSSPSMEHHSNIVPWQMLREREGRELRVAPIDDARRARCSTHSSSCSARARKLVAIDARLQRARHRQPGRSSIVALAHARGVPVLVDGAQAVPHLPVDVQALDCDFYAFSGHKMYGPTGIGVLYGKRGAAGGDAAVAGRRRHDPVGHLREDRPTTTLPYKFEAGTPNIAGAIGLGAAIDYLDRHRASTRSPRTSSDLLAYAIASARRDPRPAPHRHRAGARPASSPSCSTACIRTTSARSSTATASPSAPAITAPSRSWSASALPATARASFAFYNTRDEVDALVRRPAARCGRSFGVMSDLRDLYQEVILDHGRKPRNFRRARQARAHRAEGHQPAVRRPADRLPVDRGRPHRRRRFQGRGCAISHGVGLADDRGGQGQDRGGGRAPVRALPRAAHRQPEDAADALATLGKLAVFAGVREFPVRVKCATLPWHTLVAALDRATQPVKTE